MAKSNPLRTEELTLSLNTQAVWYLDQLIKRGLHGNSRAEAAKMLISQQCESLIDAGKLEQAPPPNEAAR